MRIGFLKNSLRFAFQSQTKLYLISDFFNGGELFHYLSNGRFSENRARFYAAEIALGLQYLHEHGIVYRDLKPENILLKKPNDYEYIKITDFGFATYVWILIRLLYCRLKVIMICEQFVELLVILHLRLFEVRAMVLQ